MLFTYVIEHMEEDDDTPRAIPEWVELEYRHMRTLAGPGSQVHFTALSAPSRISLAGVFDDSANSNTPGSGSNTANASAHSIGILELMKREGVKLEEVCLLDPKAEKELAPEDGDGRFKWFLFGGILGDDPPRDRTAQLRTLGFPNRHLGSVQMTTDTALGVTKTVVQDNVPLTEISYVDFPTIVFNAQESVEMPFRYVVKDGQPLLPPGMRQHLQKDLDKSFEF